MRSGEDKSSERLLTILPDTRAGILIDTTKLVVGTVGDDITVSALRDLA